MSYSGAPMNEPRHRRLRALLDAAPDLVGYSHEQSTDLPFATDIVVVTTARVVWLIDLGYRRRPDRERTLDVWRLERPVVDGWTYKYRVIRPVALLLVRPKSSVTAILRRSAIEPTVIRW
jgi:hypothetical protein